MGFLTSMPMLPTFKGYLMFSFQTKKKYKKYYHQVPCACFVRCLQPRTGSSGTLNWRGQLLITLPGHDLKSESRRNGAVPTPSRLAKKNVYSMCMYVYICYIKNYVTYMTYIYNMYIYIYIKYNIPLIMSII